MCEFHRTGRRAFLTDLGRGALAISVFTPILGACSSVSRESGQPATTVRPDITSVSSTASPTTGAPVESTAAAAPTTPEVTATAALDDSGVPITYRRINLGFVSAYLLVRGNEAAVIDTGIAGSAAAVGDALDAASLDWTAVRHVLLTHHHPDHAGSIGDVLTAAVNATAYAGEADVASITAPRTVSSVVDGDEVFGLQIVGTPGHTAGHIAIYDPLGKVLVAGDAINNVDGLSGPNPQFSSDMVTALESAKALANISLDTIFFGHGDPIEGGAGLRLREAAANW
jgi:glyoxylase-like metal-dependent hydrolase (beta-lactamase superfamily II)